MPTVDLKKEDNYALAQLRELITKLEEGKIHALEINVRTSMDNYSYTTFSKTTVISFVERILG